ncbi:hypothetical protein HYDPIDRAFT_175090 [Hydnomerulius pinastri MD-312]|uniref:C3H1-type domain-containing protein n=1 Tax=Hydnomerulius pinastri MD-312 TaxID=994086 RepID=A0A0C9WAK0_9AGAM|nr:hypothetical protein HYDPIDRAFT_175090 [Hydnomerulius pinastri MD-312]
MVSPLWNACSEGNTETVLGLLNDASPVDIEIRDHNGVTPLLEAVKNGHVDVVKVLLDRGADASFATMQGRPEMYTTNPEIIELLNNASAKVVANGLPAQDHSYPQDPHADPSKRFYPVPAHPYGYYAPMGPVPTMPDGSPAYYQPPQMPLGENGGFGHLPPPEVARFIPCRYYPACRYGSSCLFAHPQGPYYPGPPPAPNQYPAPYDPMTQQYTHSYYPPPPPPPSFHPSAPVPPHMNPVSPPSAPIHTPPHPPMVHARSGSEVMSPVQVPYTPTSAPPPVPYGPMSPVSPSSYPQPAHAPLPLSIPTLPPPHQPTTAPGPQSPQSMYPNGPISAPPFAVRQDPAPYPPHGPHAHSTYPEVNGGPKSPPVHPQGENYGPPPVFRGGMNHNRRGSMRRGSFGGNRKPACLFYPAGRCRNGDDCRFPHVIPDASAQPHLGARGPRPREVPAANGTNGISTIEENFAAMNVRDDAQPRRNGTNGTANSSRSQSTDPGSRPRGIKSNGPRVDKKPVLKQRVPNADEFPVLGGSAPPSSRSSVNGSAGPTAAQILSAPAPFRKDSTKESVTRSSSPEERQAKSPSENRPTEVNGVQPNGTSNTIPVKLPVSFAAAATGTPDVVKEVSVSA